MSGTHADHKALRQHRSHPRDWHRNAYVYPVISRRSQGLSIGVNLNPDTLCNFDCIYCQVDRSGEPPAGDIDLTRLREELSDLIAAGTDGSLFLDPAFADVPDPLHAIKDIAFSGDGEPTSCSLFGECVDLVVELRRKTCPDTTKIVLITNATYLTKPGVAAALAVMDANNGQIWAKLDAGTDAYYQMVCRTKFPLQHILANITAAARVRPIVVQSLFMRINGRGPDDRELGEYVERLREITGAGGKIACVHVYTVARQPAERFVTPLTADEVDRIADLVRRGTDLQVERFYGSA